MKFFYYGFCFQAWQGADFNQTFPKMRAQGLSTVEIASILVMWVPHFCTPFVHYPTYRGCAQRWGELTGKLEGLKGMGVRMGELMILLHVSI